MAENPFDKVDRDDRAQVVSAQEKMIKEQWVAAMETKIVGEALGDCYRSEGVNHYENCRHIAERYLDMLRNSRVKGWMAAERNYDP